MKLMLRPAEGLAHFVNLDLAPLVEFVGDPERDDFTATVYLDVVNGRHYRGDQARALYRTCLAVLARQPRETDR